MSFFNFIKEYFSSFQSRTYSPFDYCAYTLLFLLILSFFPITAYFVNLSKLNLTIHTLSLAYFSFFLGKTLELRRISGNWLDVLKCMGSAFLVSLLIFIAPEKYGKIPFQDRLDFWPISFSIFFLILGVQLYSSKITVKLSEGTTLLHSLGLLYFLMEFVFKNELHPLYAIIFIPFIFYSLFHALTYKELTRKHRLCLSLWSSFVMLFFSAIYINNVFHMKNIGKLIIENNLSEAFKLLLECFFLGASGAYILQNILMLLSYVPEKNYNFTYLDYRRKLIEANELHIQRYSESQVDRKESIFVLLFLGIIYVSNFYYEFVTPNLAIWFCFITVPLVVSFFVHTLNKVRA
jgi:hypothetical protein